MEMFVLKGQNIVLKWPRPPGLLIVLKIEMFKNTYVFG